MNFALILFVLLIITGVLWCLDHFKYRKLRAPGAKEPLWVDWGAGFFPVILIVFLLRSFVVEPFKIPSGSMIPTLQIGDFILVNKYVYGIRLPIINKKIINVGNPQRGDVMVFRYPEDPSLDYIKRVIGLPGDQVEVSQGVVKVNGVPLTEPYLNELPSYANIWTVPEGKLFVLGDNRNYSSDSHEWGFVDESWVVGKAVVIYWPLDQIRLLTGPDLVKAASVSSQ